MASITVDQPDLSTRGLAASVPALDPRRTAGRAKRVVASGAGGDFEVTTPLTGELIARLPASTPEDVSTAIEAGRAAQARWAATSLAERGRIFLAYHDLVLRHQDQLLDLIQLESGKTRLHAFEEVADTAMCARHYARMARSYLQPKRKLGAIPVLTQAVQSNLPKGVVGVVSPWNYPLSMGITDAIPALMAGNAVVARPDVKGSLTMLLATELLYQAGLPEGVLQIVLGAGSVAGQAVVDQADYVCYTGSTPTGRRIAQSAAGRLISYSLELGGKNSMIVRADAPLERTVSGALRASFSSAGQLCVHAERIIVNRAIAERFIPAFVAQVGQMKLGAELAFGPDMGSLVSAEQLETVTRHVEDAVAKGATVLTGGQARPEIGPYFFEPTVLQGVTDEMACRNEETFGPVVSIYVVDSDEEAIALANDTEYGLNSSIWTRDISAGRALATKVKTGTVNINEGFTAAWGSMGAAMGGMKASGVGRRHGAEGILKYTEAQNVAAQHFVAIAPSFGMSQQAYVKSLSLGLRALKIIGIK